MKTNKNEGQMTIHLWPKKFQGLYLKSNEKRAEGEGGEGTAMASALKSFIAYT